MIKLTVKTEDFEGNQITEDCFFHLNKMELSEIEVKYAKEGGLAEYMKTIEKTQDAESMFDFVKELLIKGYGMKSENGKAFIKDPRITEEFRYGYVLPECMVELMSDTTGKKMLGFINGMLPKSVQDSLKEEIRKNPAYENFR